MNVILDLISQRRAVKLFEPVEISKDLRRQILNAARHAPSSFNLQPYRFYWVQSDVKKATVAKLCLSQKPAETASALIVAVADLKSLSVTSQDQLEWMRTSDLTEEKIRDYERKAKIGRILFKPGPFGIFAAIKWALFRLLNLRMVIGLPPLFQQDLFKWATKSTSLACQNLMIAAEALGMNTCPMEGFANPSSCRYLVFSDRTPGLRRVIPLGKKSGA